MRTAEEGAQFCALAASGFMNLCLIVEALCRHQPEHLTAWIKPNASL
jgi:hypothetical protein